jgi:hypothetical protein
MHSVSVGTICAASVGALPISLNSRANRANAPGARQAADNRKFKNFCERRLCSPARQFPGISLLAAASELLTNWTQFLNTRPSPAIYAAVAFSFRMLVIKPKRSQDAS